MNRPGPRSAAAAVLALLAAGCSIDPGTGARPPGSVARASRAARETEQNQAWQNHTLAELLQAKGPPRLWLDIPGGGNPPGFIAVYPADAATGCVDTFAIMNGRETRVRLYQCR